MATFAKATFSAPSYAAFRPSYPSSLYNTVLAYHRGPKRLCLDLGCGTGIVTRELSKHFDRVIGTDPSAGMIRQARESVQGKKEYGSIEFREGNAEDGAKGLVEDGEVDMVVAGQAAHWFDQSRLWPEMKRILRKEGTVAFWGYKDHVFVDLPKATKIMQSYAYDLHPDKLGSYWPMPGRRYVHEKLRVIKPPEADFEEMQRVEYEPGVQGRHSGEGTLFMERRLTVGECKEYVRTWSSYHGWQEKHPEQVARSKGGSGDIIDELFDEIAEETPVFRADGNMIDIEWGSGVVVARKR